jgi:hypothetical protein
VPSPSSSPRLRSITASPTTLSVPHLPHTTALASTPPNASCAAQLHALCVLPRALACSAPRSASSASCASACPAPVAASAEPGARQRSVRSATGAYGAGVGACAYVCRPVSGGDGAGRERRTRTATKSASSAQHAQSLFRHRPALCRSDRKYARRSGLCSRACTTAFR